LQCINNKNNVLTIH